MVNARECTCDAVVDGGADLTELQIPAGPAGRSDSDSATAGREVECGVGVRLAGEHNMCKQ